MKQPYLQEKTLHARVEKFMNEHRYVDLDDMTDYMIMAYSEFRGKNRKLFMRSVEKAYEWQLYLRNKNNEEESDPDDISDINGCDLDVMEIVHPVVKVPSINNMLTKMYKTPPKSSSFSSRNNTPRSVHFKKDIVIIDGEGDQSMNESSSSMKSVKKKRRKEIDDDLEEIIKRNKKQQVLPEQSTITFGNMAGIEPLKDKICDMLASLKWPGVLQPVLKCALITGPTGSGKTTFAQALAGTSNVPILRVTATELVGGISGESENRIKESFDMALSVAPCILLIEKIDVIAPKEGAAKSMEKRIGVQLSASLSGLKIKHAATQILVLGETSHPEKLDWDLRSSFCEEIFMTTPCESARVQILQLLSLGIATNVDFKELAHRTPGYVAGDLKKLIEKAQGIAWKRKKDGMHGDKSLEPSLMEQVSVFLEEFGNMCSSFEENNVPKADVNMQDFMEALLHIIPALKREGFPTVPDVTWQDIGGLEIIKKELREKILEPIQYSKLHEEFGASRPNGILMWGPPGCGKTLLAKAVANEAGINLLPIMGPELLNMYQGESERAVREVFHRARSVAPCVIFFDEFDSLCPVRNKGAESGSKTTIVNTLLTEMNGFAKRDDVYVIAATNRPDILDPAVTRPGRFDTLLYVDVPDHEGRISIFKACTKNGTCPVLDADVNFEEISASCSNFSGADCDQLVYLASKEAIREVIDQNVDCQVQVTRLVSRKHFINALKKIKPSISAEEQLKYKRLYRKIESNPIRGKELLSLLEEPKIASKDPASEITEYKENVESSSTGS